MAMPVVPEPRPYTVEEVLAFPADGNRYEVVQGELLVTPAPPLRHQLVVGRLYVALHDYLSPHGLADAVFTSPANITRLLLAVEVVSPSSARGDGVVKRGMYQRRAVATYWVVDPDAGLVEVWQPEDERPVIVTGELVWRWHPDVPELRVPLAQLFAPPRVRGR